MSFPSPFLGNKKRIYWIVGCGLGLRHATKVLPGALPHGEWVPSLCETWIRLPFSTPFGREPASKGIQARCSLCIQATECLQGAEGDEWRGVIWDS